MIAKTLQPALPMALQNDSSPVGGLGSDEYRQAKRRAMARTLCENATTPAAWLIADRLAQSWGFSCAALGTPRPVDPDGERATQEYSRRVRRVGVVQRG